MFFFLCSKNYSKSLHFLALQEVEGSWDPGKKSFVRKQCHSHFPLWDSIAAPTGQWTILGVGEGLKQVFSRLWPWSFGQGGEERGRGKIRKPLFKNVSYFRIAVQNAMWSPDVRCRIVHSWTWMTAIYGWLFWGVKSPLDISTQSPITFSTCPFSWKAGEAERRLISPAPCRELWIGDEAGNINCKKVSFEEWYAQLFSPNPTFSFPSFLSYFFLLSLPLTFSPKIIKCKSFLSAVTGYKFKPTRVRNCRTESP